LIGDLKKQMVCGQTYETGTFNIVLDRAKNA